MTTDQTAACIRSAILEAHDKNPDLPPEGLAKAAIAAVCKAYVRELVGQEIGRIVAREVAQ